MVSGILQASGDSIAAVSKMCRDYGVRIIKEILLK